MAIPKSGVCSFVITTCRSLMNLMDCRECLITYSFFIIFMLLLSIVTLKKSEISVFPGYGSYL